MKVCLSLFLFFVLSNAQASSLECKDIRPLVKKMVEESSEQQYVDSSCASSYGGAGNSGRCQLDRTALRKLKSYASRVGSYLATACRDE